ncbi:MAG TPA: exodeoxyribonuclease VII small subunit [Solirubrobacterales bacterium]|nr:exodeoxyribonuclease VII small subunit [Solirubrobacterales bacterium]
MGEGENERNYESAVERLEKIIERLDSGHAGLRETLDLCREGRDLVTFCATELDAVGQDLKELRLDELAAGLERTPAPTPDSQPSQAQS